MAGARIEAALVLVAITVPENEIMAKKTERKRLDEECLRLWSLCVRARDKTCRNCNSDMNLQSHHLIQRTYKLSRYNTLNGICLCRRCHFPEHITPEKFRDMILNIIGEENYLALKNCYMIQYKWTISELKEIKEGLKAELKRIESE